MKLFTGSLLAVLLATATQINAQSIFDKVKLKVKQRAAAKMDNAIDRSLDKVEGAAKPQPSSTPAAAERDSSKEKNTAAPKEKNATKEKNTNTANNDSAVRSDGALQVYLNYDFVAGNQILFYDDFSEDMTGEFPAHWALIKGQGTVGTSGDKKVFHILNGSYAYVKPRLKSKEYLPDAFTIEFDYFFNKCGLGADVFLIDAKGSDTRFISIGRLSQNAHTEYFKNDALEVQDLEGTPMRKSNDAFWDSWHHIAIAYQKPQIKLYIDESRVLAMPNIGFEPKAVEWGGTAGDEKCPITIANVRIAGGGGQNMIGAAFANGNKFITQGILFDTDKATIKPQSMGTFNEIYAYLYKNKSAKFEIDGYTDNAGNSQHNIALSQQRADAVKTLLANMGIEGARLTAKGFGAAKPIAPNDTPQGKANNRRVEFVKL